MKNKKDLFFEQIWTFTGKSLKDIASELGIAQGTLRSYLQELGGKGSYKIKDGRLLIESPESIDLMLSNRRPHGLETGRGGSYARRTSDPDWLPNGGLHGRAFNLGDLKGSQEFLRTLDQIEAMSINDEKSVLEQIRKKGSIGSERKA